jgi:glucosamine kinase
MKMGEDLILGIDGGGSKVLVALADRSGRILRVTRGRGVNPMDNPNWREELDLSLSGFMGEPRLAAIGAALPAYGEVAHLSQQQREAISQAFGAIPQRVLNDVDAAHLGAFAGGPGILILSGTGSMAWARDAQGNSSRAGGWGDVIGDEGSSYWIGRAALSLVSQSLDGRGGPTALVRGVFDHLCLDISDPINALAGWASSLTTPRSQIAALAALVDRAAQAGDAGALALIDRAADELARHFTAIAGDSADTSWTYAGGTFASRPLLTALEKRIGRPPKPPRLPPIGGALLAAAQLLDWPLDEDWIGQIAASAEAAMAQSGEANLK